MKIRALSSFSHPQDSAQKNSPLTLPLPPFFFPLVTPFPSGRHGTGCGVVLGRGEGLDRR